MLLALDDTVGALFLGLVLSAILYGVATVQVYFYYKNYKTDYSLLRVAVAVLWFLDTLIFVFWTHAMYSVTVTNWGNFLALGQVGWSLKGQYICTAFLIPFVQTLYSMRVWKVSDGRRVIPALSTVCAVAAWAVGLLSGVIIVRDVKTFSDANEIRWVLDTSLGVATVVDFYMAAALCYYLQKSKGDTHSTNSMLNWLMVWIVSTGALTSMCSISTLILYAAMPTNLIYLGVELLLTKLYVNSFLAMLNLRQHLREMSRIVISTDSDHVMASRLSPSGLPPPQTTALARSIHEPMEMTATLDLTKRRESTASLGSWYVDKASTQSVV